jgi:hypothetical protein
MFAAGLGSDEIELVTASDVTRRVEDFDGILFAGGEDVDPKFYNENPKYESVHVDRSRDEFENDAAWRCPKGARSGPGYLPGLSTDQREVRRVTVSGPQERLSRPSAGSQANRKPQ